MIKFSEKQYKVYIASGAIKLEGVGFAFEFDLPLATVTVSRYADPTLNGSMETACQIKSNTQAVTIIAKNQNILNQAGAAYSPTGDYDVLSTALSALLATGGGGGGGDATEANQQLQIDKATDANNLLTDIKKIQTDSSQKTQIVGTAASDIDVIKNNTASTATSANQTNGNQISKNFIEAVDLGLIPNYSTVKKSGKNFDLDTATMPESVWNGGGLYTGFPTGAIEELQVISSSASDIGTLTITYLPTSASTDYITANVAVNGTTPVNTGITAYRVHTAFYTSTANTSTQFNVGVITVRYRTTTTTVFLAMPAGRSQTYMSGYTVPAGKRGLLMPTTWRASAVAGAFLECAMYIRPLGAAPRLRRNVTTTVGTAFRDNYEGGILVNAGTDIMPTVISSSTNNVTVEASYEILIFPI